MSSPLIKNLFSRQLWNTIGHYAGLGKFANTTTVNDLETLQKFINSRASHVAQNTLYGYLKTRAGTSFPQLFENESLLVSIDIAKWQIWLACMSDLSVYMGGLICTRSEAKSAQIASNLVMIADALFAETQHPEEQKQAFEDNMVLTRDRLLNTDYTTITDDAVAFSTSSEALYYWAPIAMELKQYDKKIVKNSIRFKWQEIRRVARKKLDAQTLASHLN